VPPLASNAHVTRAILLASATATTLKGPSYQELREPGIRWHQRYLVAKLREFTRPIMSCRAGFHANKIVTPSAKSRHPELTREQAFSKIFTADDVEGRALRRAWQISKGQVPTEPTDEDDGDENALDELNTLAEQERHRNPGMSKAAAFAKIYTHPANASIAARERRQNRPRA
jgi:hypothetical protein